MHHPPDVLLEDLYAVIRELRSELADQKHEVEAIDRDLAFLRFEPEDLRRKVDQ